MGISRKSITAVTAVTALVLLLSSCAPASPDQEAQQAAQDWVKAVMDRKPADAAKFACEESTADSGIVSSKFDQPLYDLYTSGESGLVIPKGGDWKINGTVQSKDDKSHYVVTGKDAKAGAFSVTIRLKAGASPCVWSLDTSQANKP